MKTVKLNRRVTIFDITPPFRLSENRAEVYYQELRNTHIEPRLNFLISTTCRGEFCTYDGKANNVRIEADSRWITDNEVIEVMNNVFEAVYQKTKRQPRFKN